MIKFRERVNEFDAKMVITEIEIDDRRLKLTESKLKTNFKLLLIPVFIIAGVYFFYISDSVLGSALLVVGLQLVLSNEDAMKGLNTIKDLLSK